MKKKAVRRPYAPRLNKDTIGRHQIIILKMAGFTTEKIASLTGRHERTINHELTRPEHREIFHECITTIGKQKLSGDDWTLVEKALEEREA